MAFAEAQAAREVGQLLLSGVASPLHLAVLLLRFGLPACGPAAGAPGAATAACSLARTGTLSYAVTSGAPGGAGGKLRSSSRAVEFRLEPGETLEGDAEELRSFGAVARRLGISRQYAEKAYRAALGALGQHAAQLAQQGAL